MHDFRRPTMLMILDGFGYNPDSYGNAIAMAKKPFIHELFSQYPYTFIESNGLDVGLPAGQMGNSEVGHMNIGAGRIIYQDLSKISNAIADGSFLKNQALLKAMNHCKKKQLGPASHGPCFRRRSSQPYGPH